MFQQNFNTYGAQEMLTGAKKKDFLDFNDHIIYAAEVFCLPTIHILSEINHHRQWQIDRQIDLNYKQMLKADITAVFAWQRHE